MVAVPLFLAPQCGHSTYLGGVTGNVAPQNRHILASTFTVSAHRGHFFSSEDLSRGARRATAQANGPKRSPTKNHLNELRFLLWATMAAIVAQKSQRNRYSIPFPFSFRLRVFLDRRAKGALWAPIKATVGEVGARFHRKKRRAMQAGGLIDAGLPRW